jgi:hypothetical protein
MGGVGAHSLKFPDFSGWFVFGFLLLSRVAPGKQPDIPDKKINSSNCFIFMKLFY